MALQPSVAVAEERAQSRCHDRCGLAQRRAELKCDAVTDNGFGVAIGYHGASTTLCRSMIMTIQGNRQS
jgi:hypothetical protein